MRASALVAVSAVLLLSVSAFAAPGPLAFGAPVKLNPEGLYGYEPGIDVDSLGTLFITAHKSSVVAEGARLSSWLWYSADDGATWHEMPSPAQAHDKLYALEGDLAVDALDRLYYVDTIAADNTISRWSRGPTWDYSLPLQRSTYVDDRPWLAAHGDGIVYYLGNSAVKVPGAENAAEGSADLGRYQFYRSEDGGLTWTVGRVVPHSGWCGIEASGLDDQTVYTVCVDDRPMVNLPRCLGTVCVFDPPQGRGIFVQESHDRGRTFSETRVADLKGEFRYGFPSITVDGAGNVYAAWTDGKPDERTKLTMARWTPSTGWTTSVVPTPPDAATVHEAWIDSGSDGVVAIAYYASPDTRPTSESAWRTFVAVTASGSDPTPVWETTDASGIVDTGTAPPQDFMQVTVGPDDKVHLTYGKDVPNAPPPIPTVWYDNDLYYVGQVSGPNLG